jgi:hypothetical protein
MAAAPPPPAVPPRFRVAQGTLAVDRFMNRFITIGGAGVGPE